MLFPTEEVAGLKLSLRLLLELLFLFLLPPPIFENKSSSSSGSLTFYYFLLAPADFKLVADLLDASTFTLLLLLLLLTGDLGTFYES